MATINGGNGADLIVDPGGDDRISGGNGADVIEAGPDSGRSAIVFTGSRLTAFDLGDVVTGGRGNDVFRFNGGSDDHDLITDFRPGNDRLELLFTEPDRVQQVVITGGVHGPGLLIITDVGPDVGDNTDGLFLQGVTRSLAVGTELVFT